ncbi:MAG: peptidoglycan DD-metalloendopeptidase family protein, partial [Candidatus Binatia bacterium]
SAEKLKDLQQQIERTERETQSIEKKAESVLGEIEALDRSIATRERRVKDLAAAIRSAQASLEAAESKVADLDAQLPRLRAAFAARARGLYRLTLRGPAPLVFQTPRELTEALRYRRSLEAVLAYDHDLAEELRRNRADADAARQQAAEQATALAARSEESKREIAASRTERSSKRTLLASLRGEGQKHNRLLAELKSAAEKLRELIESEEAAARTAPFRPPPGEAAHMTTPLHVAAGSVSTARNGVEIRAPAGTPVQAVRAGRVVYAGWFTGYGKMVIVDHGERLYSVYGYASDLLVEAGRVVAEGASIATVGTTGPVSSPSLYFEIRDHGVPRDPTVYIPALSRK